MNSDGTFDGEQKRQKFPWGVRHTSTRNNKRIWPTDRPIPIAYDVEMGWHHIIPWNTLRSSWSALAGSGRWEVIEAWMALLSEADPAARLREMKARELGGNTADDLSQRICWARWNLVEGPSHRDDDPGEGLDRLGGRNASSKLNGRVSTLVQIYDIARGWRNDTNNLTERQTSGLLKLLGDLRSYARSPIQMFEAKMWEVVDPGRFDKNGQVLRNKYPIWHRAK